MLILSEKRLRIVIREELERFMESPQETNSYSIKSVAGGELIMPNPVKEGFDEGKIKSVGDIII